MGMYFRSYNNYFKDIRSGYAVAIRMAIEIRGVTKVKKVVNKNNKNRFSLKEYIIAYIIGYLLAVAQEKKVIYSPIHLGVILQSIGTLAIIAIKKQPMFNSRDIGIRIFIKYMPVCIVLWLTRTILNTWGTNTEFIFGW